MFLKRCCRNSQSLNAIKHRSSRPEVFCKKVSLETLQNSQESTCARASFFNKVPSVRPSTLLKKRFWYRRFPVDFGWWLLLKAIATLFSIGKASRNRVSCFSSLFLTKIKVSINVPGVIRKSALNCCLMARSYLLFHICWNHKRSKPFLLLSNQMIDNAIFKLCERENLFLSGIYLRIILQGFWRLLINCLNSNRSNFSFITAHFFTSTVFTFFTSTYCTDISRYSFVFSQLLFQNMLII